MWIVKEDILFLQKLLWRMESTKRLQTFYIHFTLHEYNFQLRDKEHISGYLGLK